jgi:hypothetical protein
MDATRNSTLVHHLAALVLGLIAFAIAARTGLLDVGALLRIAAVGVLLLILGAATLQPILSEVAQPHERSATDRLARPALDRWLCDQAARGSLCEPIEILRRRASRALRRSIGRIELCAAIERLDAARIVGGVR